MCEPSLTQRCEAGQQRSLRTGGSGVRSQAFTTQTSQVKVKAVGQEAVGVGMCDAPQNETGSCVEWLLG